jgi:hypothetical protein
LAAACFEIPDFDPISVKLLSGFAKYRIEVWIAGEKSLKIISAGLYL